MTDDLAPKLWRMAVDQTVQALANATSAEQQIGVVKLADRFGPEAGKEAKRLFAAGARAHAQARAQALLATTVVLAKSKPLAEPAEPPCRPWSETAPPLGASELEALTCVPRLVGDIVEWIVSGAIRPNRMMALGVASVVIGTLIGRRIQGPTGSATHLYLIILAPTGYGKDDPLKFGAALMDAVGAADLLGPGEWASSPGFTKRLKRNPLMVCFVDELGDELSKVKNQTNNVWLTAIIGLLKKTYNAWEIVHTAEKVGEQSERIDWPAPSIVGAATPEKFFDALQPSDLESGFANRLLILPFEGCRRPPEQSPDEGADVPPKSLVAALTAIRRKPEVDLDASPADGGPVRLIRERIDWGPGAKEIYLAFSRQMDALQDTDAQRYQLSMRACENAVRLATNVAVGRGSGTVDREDITWAIAVASQSLDAACGRFDKYMRQYFEFPKFCDEVLRWMSAQDGKVSRRDLERKFRGHSRRGFELAQVVDQLLREERIEVVAASVGTRGPVGRGYRVVVDEVDESDELGEG